MTPWNKVTETARALQAARQQLHQAEEAFKEERALFYKNAEPSDLLAELRTALAGSNMERWAAISILYDLPVDPLELADPLVELSLSHRWAGPVRKLLAPHLSGKVDEGFRSAVLSRLNADDDALRRLCELADAVGDFDLLDQMVAHAKASDDPHKREVGADFS